MNTGVSEHRTQVYFPDALHARLQSYARKHGLSVAEVVRRSVASLLDEEYPGDDPLIAIVGAATHVGVRDGSVHHDRYVYGQPAGKKQRKAQGNRNRRA